MDRFKSMFQQLKAWRADQKREIAEGDKLWQENKEQYGWELPTKAHVLLRIPVIRNIRYTYHYIMLQGWVENWSAIDAGICTANRFDEWILWAIYRGWY